MIRLLEHTLSGAFRLVSVNDEDPPPYAILSHTWTEGQEVTYHDLVEGTGEDKSGYEKIRFCGRQAAADGLRHFWVDTCCINKSAGVELSTAINSMFRWYQRASKCYVYLTDVVVPDEVADAETFPITWAEAFRRSRWFTRGWTLQELLAPPCVEFFSKNGMLLGSRISLEQEIHEITKIAREALRGRSLDEFSIMERTGWAAQRTTKLKEDKIYCLLGIFGVFLPPLYGEGEAYATLRLRREIETRLGGWGTAGPLDLSDMLSEAMKRIQAATTIDTGCSVTPSSGNEPFVEEENQSPENCREQEWQNHTSERCKMCCQLLQQNIPPQVLLENPVILYDGFGQRFAFNLNWVTSLNVRQTLEYPLNYPIY